MTRLADAIAIRNWALAVVATSGHRIAPQGVPVTMARVGALSVTLTDAKDFDRNAAYYRQLIVPDDDAPVPKGKDLDIWFRGRKVFGFDWDDDEPDTPPHIRCFKRGPWEVLCRKADRPEYRRGMDADADRASKAHAVALDRATSARSDLVSARRILRGAE